MRRFCALVLPVAVVACSLGQPSSTPTPLAPSPSASEPVSSPVPTAPVPATPAQTDSLTGIWVSDLFTHETMADMIEMTGLDPAKLDDIYGDWDQIGDMYVELLINGTEWIDTEYTDGAAAAGWQGAIRSFDDSTLVVTDVNNNCDSTLNVERTGDQLSFEVIEDLCPDDLELLTTLYEMSPFKLVRDAAWSAPEPTPKPTESIVVPPLGRSTSSSRITLHPAGTLDGAPLGYLEYLPPSYDETGDASPLILFLHGSGESGSGTEAALRSLTGTAIPGLIDLNEWPDERPFVVIAPQHDEEPPSFCLDPTEIDGMLRFALDRYNVDPKRLYLTGLSCGAIGLWNYLEVHGNELVAAAIPIAGNGIGAIETKGCDLGLTPIWAFHGAADENVPVYGDEYPISVLQECTDPAPVDARVTIMPNVGHAAWGSVYGLWTGYDIYDWLLGHHK